MEVVPLICTFQSTEHCICLVRPGRGSNPGQSALNASALPIECIVVKIVIFIVLRFMMLLKDCVLVSRTELIILIQTILNMS